MSDVAKAAGVSTTTVSLVLSGKAEGQIPSATRERVISASRDLGYRTNVVARNLRRQSSDTIGLISDTIASSPYAGSMILGADQVAAAAGKTLMIVNTERDPDVERRAIESMLDQQVEAIIYATMWHQVVDPPALLDEVHSVILDSQSTDLGDSWVTPDDEGGGYAATRHLIATGHRRIGYIHEVNAFPAHSERLAGYRRALAESDIEFDPALVSEGPNDPFGGTAATARLLELADPPTAVQCYTDRMAMGAYRAIRYAGLRVPADISVIGYDDQDQIAPWLDPPLTTVRLPHEAMGRWAVKHLLAVLAGEVDRPMQARLPCPLVVRDSVAPPRARTASAEASRVGPGGLAVRRGDG